MKKNNLNTHSPLKKFSFTINIIMFLVIIYYILIYFAN